jgi:hypothetical protein
VSTVLGTEQADAGPMVAQLRAEARLRPYRTLTAAGTAGFVLGGGLAGSLGGILLRAAARAAVVGLASALLQGPSSSRRPPV